MATTPIAGLALMDGGSVVSPIQVPINAMLNQVDDAFGMVYASIGQPGSLTGTNAERLALSAPTLRDGLTFFATDTGIAWRYRASSWRRLEEAPFIQSGRRTSVSVTPASSSLSWDFPVPFKDPPALICSPCVANNGQVILVDARPTTTATTANVHLTSTGGNINGGTFQWIAIGERA